jgi:segregation and condensation protein A
MDVRDLDLTTITRQYLDYLARMRDLNFDLAGDYLYLAATLVLLKSKTCISDGDLSLLENNLDPDGDLKITSQAELIRRLEEYQHYQKLGEKLWQLPRKGHEIFIRPKGDRKAIVNSILTPIELDQLTLAMVDLIQKEKRKFTVMERERLSIRDKLIFFKEFLKMGMKTNFEDLIEEGGGKGLDNIVISFISLLELTRLKKVSIYQDEGHKNIYVDVVESLENFDVDLADGFEEEGGVDTSSVEKSDELMANLVSQNMDGNEAASPLIQ